jgi:hypothetical protein
MKDKGYLMASGVFFAGFLCFVAAKCLKFEKGAVTLSTIAGMVVGAGISAKAIANLEGKTEVTV